MHDVFISYTSEDAQIASSIARQLEKEGLSVFFDREVLVAGESFAHAIAMELKNAQAVIVLLSGNSQRSIWVQDELSAALKSKKTIVPILLDNAARDNWIWPLVANRHSITLDTQSPNRKAEVRKLAKQLRQQIQPQEPPNSIGKPDRPLEAPMRSNWITIAIAIASAALGGLVVWWLR